MKQPLKLPHFASEDAERDFWDQIDLGDVALFKADGIDVQDPRKPITILFRQGQPPLRHEHTIVGILDRKAQQPDGIFKTCLRRLHSESRAFDAVSALACQFKQLLNHRLYFAASPKAIALRPRTLCAEQQHRIRKEPGRDLLPLAGIDPVSGNEQIQILLEEEGHRFGQIQTDGRRWHRSG